MSSKPAGFSRFAAYSDLGDIEQTSQACLGAEVGARLAASAL